MENQRVIDHISNWLKEYCTTSGQHGFVVGISGGIDSALTSTLCALTGLPTLCVELPIHQHISQVQRGAEHIRWLGTKFQNVKNEIVDLSTVFDTLAAALPQPRDQHVVELSLANTRARLRMTTLYYFAGILRHLVVGTGNKVEDLGVGFFTKYGDGGVDLSPIADLTKTEVYELAAHLGIVANILDAPPTDGLWGDDRTDADQIGASYPELEWAMELRNSGSEGQPVEITGRQREVLAIYDRMHKANRHKMVPIPICEVPEEMKH